MRSVASADEELARCATVPVADAYVVDTGVPALVMDQDGFEHARELQQRLIDGSATAETVDFARVEVAGVLRERGFLAGRLTLEEFTAAVRVIDDIGVTVHPATADRLERAARKMLGDVRRVVRQLARELDSPFLTSDAKLTGPWTERFRSSSRTSLTCQVSGRGS
jgi:predicted nucleic acid-binding protein